MQGKSGKISLIVILMLCISWIFFAAGCPKKQTTPPEEEKKEASEPGPPPKAAQETEKAKPASTPTPTPPSPKPAPPSQPSPPPPSAPQDPRLIAIASGEILLNPTVNEDAQLIQTRLSDLGLYKGSIDGIWGKGSQASLKAFKEQNSLHGPFRWDKETQVLLFREMPSDPEALNRAISRGEVLLDPAIPQDAKLIQTRLAEFGFYKGGIDGIWGKGSKAALKAFKEKNSLENTDQWDKETQMNLFR